MKESWIVNAETRFAGIQKAWCSSKAEAQTVAREQRARRVYIRVWVEREQPKETK